MREQFIDGFMAELNGEVSDEDAKTSHIKYAI